MGLANHADIGAREEHAMTRKTIIKDPRDIQARKLYGAERLVELMLTGDYAAQSFTQEETLGFINAIIRHPAIRARWKIKDIHVDFKLSKGHKNGYADKETNTIELPEASCNPIWIIHEVGHLLPTVREEPAHDAGFAAILSFIYLHILGEEASILLESCFLSTGVICDITQIPATKSRRRKPPTQILPIPKTLTINTARLLSISSKDDVANILIAALRNAVLPEPMKALPIDPRFTPKSSKRTDYVAARKARQKDQTKVVEKAKKVARRSLK